jgi:elongation factor P
LDTDSEANVATYGANDLKPGLKILLDGDPFTIVESDFVKPGKGQAFTRIRVRNLKNGRVIERTFKSNETVEGADATEQEMQFLYQEGELFHFMAPDTFEQLTATEQAMAEAKPWLKEQDVVTVTLFNGEVLSVAPPHFVNLRITATEPGIRGDTATGGSKPATLETGAVVRVPLFIEEGEVIRVDTRTASYISRVKE